VAFLEDSGYLKFIKDDQEKIDLVNQFLKKIKTFEESTIEPTLKNFMEQILLELEAGEEGKLEFDSEKGPDMIKVMTIHGAKGLEFKYVFIANMVDRRFPTDQRKDPIELPDELIKDIKPTGDVHLQEERRLCYVAMTRAKKELHFTSSEDYGGQRKKKLSRFLNEMGYKTDDAKTADSKTGVLAEKIKTPAIEKIKKEYLPDHFSFSQLAAFEKCPLQYKFGFILKVPVKGKAVFSFGHAMHNTLYDFFKLVNEAGQKNLFGEKSAKKDKLQEELLKLYEKNWVDEWYESKKQKEEYFKKGKEIIKDFYKEYLKNPPKILKTEDGLALELPFNLKINGNTIIGKIDRIDDLGNGEVQIIDYKTGVSKDKPEKEQLFIYQMAANEVLRLKPKQLSYYYLEDQKVLSFLGSDTELENQKKKIIEEIEKIKNSEFGPTPGWQCQYCDFKDICDFAQR
jgi:DNA helicase-2/ATP-dependent DNA helicase PcrA